MDVDIKTPPPPPPPQHPNTTSQRHPSTLTQRHNVNPTPLSFDPLDAAPGARSRLSSPGLLSPVLERIRKDSQRKNFLKLEDLAEVAQWKEAACCCQSFCVSTLDAQRLLERSTRLATLKDAERFKWLCVEMMNMRVDDKRLLFRLNDVEVCKNCYLTCSSLGKATYYKLHEAVMRNSVYTPLRKTYTSVARSGCQKQVVEAILEVCALMADEMPHVFVTNPQKRRHGKRTIETVENLGTDCGLVIDPTEIEVQEEHLDEPEEVDEDKQDDPKETGDLVEHLSKELGKDVRNMLKIPAALYGDKKALYSELVRRGKVPMFLKYKTFVRYWQRHLWHVVISAWQPFAKCDACLSFRAALVMETDNAKVEELKNKQEIHRQQITLARKRVYLRECLVRAYLSRFLMIYVDGMDIKKSNIPRCRSFTYSKNVDSSGEPLDVKLMGLHSVGRGFHGYWVFPHFAANNNVTLSAILDYFKYVVQTEGSLPRYIFCQFDNSGKDNKSLVMMCFFSYLLLLGVCDTVECHFLPVGHTHALIDQNFSVINRRLGCEDLLSLDNLIQQIQDLFVTDTFYSKQKVLFNVADFNDFFLEFAEEIAGQGTVRINGIKRRLHAFKFFKPQGVPCVVVKEHDEVTAEWRGSWRNNSPLPIFKRLDAMQAVDSSSLRLAPRKPVKNLVKVQKLVNEVHKLVTSGKDVGERDVKTSKEDRDFKLTTDWPARSMQARKESEEKEKEKEKESVTNLMSKLQSKRTEFQTFATFWKWYFWQDKVFWEGRDPENTECCREPNTTTDAKKQTIPLYAFPNCVPPDDTSDNQLTIDLANLLTTTDLTQPLVKGLPASVRGALEEAVTYELQSRVKEGRDDSALYLYHKRDPPPSRSTYNPNEDCKKDQVAILRVAKSTSTNQRGWELAKVRRLYKEEESGRLLADVWYYEPVDSSWHGNWWDKRLHYIELNAPTGGKLIWADFNRDVDKEVVYSFFLTKSTNKIPVSVQKVVISQIDRITAGFEGGATGFYNVDMLNDEELSD